MAKVLLLIKLRIHYAKSFFIILKSCILARFVHNIFKKIKKRKIKKKYFYIEFFSFKIFEIGKPKEIFNPEMNNIANSNSIILNESINNITLLKSKFFSLLECIYILRCFFKI